MLNKHFTIARASLALLCIFLLHVTSCDQTHKISHKEIRTDLTSADTAVSFNLYEEQFSPVSFFEKNNYFTEARIETLTQSRWTKVDLPPQRLRASGVITWYCRPLFPVKDGDVVKIFNERGGVLAGAYVSERIMPGVISTDHGAKYDPIVQGELDRGGAINVISPANTSSKNTMGMATSGYLAEVVRGNLDELMRQYPEAFKRPFHPTAGPSVGAFLHKE